MFYSITELVEQATLHYEGNVAELMIATEFELTGREREEVLTLMTRNLEVMKESVHLGLNDQLSRSGLTGGDAAKLDRYIRSGKDAFLRPASALLPPRRVVRPHGSEG